MVYTDHISFISRAKPAADQTLQQLQID